MRWEYLSFRFTVVNMICVWWFHYTHLYGFYYAKQIKKNKQKIQLWITTVDLFSLTSYSYTTNHYTPYVKFNQCLKTHKLNITQHTISMICRQNWINDILRRILLAMTRKEKEFVFSLRTQSNPSSHNTW